MYADDTSFCLKSKDISQLNMATNRDLENLDALLKGNQLSLNIVKTRSILIATMPRHQAMNNTADNLKLEILGIELDVVMKAKYLGVQVDSSLDWKEQMKTITSKVCRAFGFLKYAKNILPIASMKTLYAGIVEPHFRCCCSVWGCCGATTINQLQKLQNRAARLLTEVALTPLVDQLSRASVAKLFVSS